MYTADELLEKGMTLSDCDIDEVANEIKIALSESVQNNSKLLALKSKLDSGSTSLTDAYNFSIALGESLESTLSKYFTTESIGSSGLTLLQIDKWINSVTSTCNSVTMSYVNTVFNNANAKVGVGVTMTEAIKASDTNVYNKYIRNLLNVPEKTKNEAITATWSSGNSILTKTDYLSKGAANDVIQHTDTQLKKCMSKNDKSGVKATIERKNPGSDECAFCRTWSQKGKFDYAHVNDLRKCNFFWRHRYCKCIFEYIPSTTSPIVETSSKDITLVSTDLNNSVRKAQSKLKK